MPIALIGTLAAIWAAGFSINILTLLALVLATGLVVDDAIVVIENISRQRGLGLGPRAAAVLGTRQVFFAVLVDHRDARRGVHPDLVLPRHRRPAVLRVRLRARLRGDALGVRRADALRRCWPRAGSATTSTRRAAIRSAARVVAVGDGAERLYARLLDACLAAPLVVVVAALLFAGAAVVAFRLLPSELTPPEDRGFIPISVSAPQGATVDYTAEQMRQVEAIVQPLRRERRGRPTSSPSPRAAAAAASCS